MALTSDSREFTSIRSLIVPIYFPAFLTFLAEGLTKSFIVLYAAELGAGPALAGAVAALTSLGTIFFDLPAGKLTDRFNLKTVYTVSTLLLGLISIIIWLLPGLYFLIPLLVLFGCARAAWSISQVTVVRRLVAPHMRGRAIANVGGLVRIGAFIGPVAGGYIAAGLGLRHLFIFAGILALTSSALLILKTPSLERESEGKRETRSIPAAFRRHSKALLTAGIGIVVLGVLRNARPVLLPLFGNHLGLGLDQIGLIMGIGGLTDLLLFYPAGIIYDRFGINRGGVLCLSVFSLGLVLVPLSTGFISLLLTTALIGIGNGFGAGINMVFSAVLAPDGEVGEFMGVWRLFTDLGLFSGPIAVGFITAAAGISVAPLALGLLGFAGAAYFRVTVKNPQ